MIDTVYNVLKQLNLPVKWQLRPYFDKSQIVISYHFFNEGDLLHGDGEGIEEGGALQIDIFSKINYTSTVKEVKKLLKCAGFLFEDAKDDTEQLDENTIIYHKILIFNYIESEVLING